MNVEKFCIALDDQMHVGNYLKDHKIYSGYPLYQQ